MAIIEFINNLAVLVALSVLSGFIGKRCRLRWQESVSQGLLFGCATVIGMLCPLKFESGVIFDGRSVMLSLCGLFFGPWAVLIAGAMATVCRLWLAGDGQVMGVCVIATSSVLGVVFYNRQARFNEDVPVNLLWCFGLLVHVMMCLLVFTLPYEIRFDVLKKFVLPIFLVCPLATVLIGKVLSDQRALARFLRELQDSEQRYRSLADSGPGLIWADNVDKKCEYVNQPWLTFTGLTLEQAKGDGWIESVHPDDRGLFLSVRAEAFDRRERFDAVYRLRRHDDVYRWILDSGSPRYDAKGNFLGYIGHCLDITDRRQAEEELRRIEWMLSKKPQNAERRFQPDPEGQDGPGALGSQGLILKSVGRDRLENIIEEGLDLLGTCSVIFEADGTYALGCFESEWCGLLNRSGCKMCRDAFGSTSAPRAVSQGEEVDVECQGGTRLYAVPVKVGETVVGAIALGYGDPPRDPARLSKIAEACHVAPDELARAAGAYDSRPPYIVEMAKRRLRSLALLIGSLVEAWQSEDARAKMEDHLRHAQKMEAIGRLAGGVAHDFNNILQSILGYGGMLLSRLPEKSELHDFVKEIVAGSKQAEALSRQLLAFARTQAVDPKVFDLNEAVTATLTMLQRLLGDCIALVWNPAQERVFVKMDTGQLDQLLVSLAVNARDAIKGTGKMVIETGREVFDEQRCAQTPGIVPGGYIVLSVADNGCGMDQTTVDRLFEPFFTTKERGKGMGLGVATVYSIVKQNRGCITVQSSPGNGTVFKIFLPEQTISEPTVFAVPEQEASPSGNQTVLVVDDEESLLRTGRRLIEALGYTVLTATGPEEALALVKRYPGEIHLLLTDVVMPGMSGRDLWRKVEPLRPAMKCVYMSGFTANIIAQRNVLDNTVNFLQKPFSKAELARKLFEVLSSSRTENA